jgi:hypothetical protein
VSTITGQDQFHGTTLENAQSILTSGFRFGKSEGLYHGDGVYFFDGSAWHALDYAMRYNRKGVQLAVIQATVTLGRCFDLSNKEHRDILSEAAAVFASKGIEASDNRLINLLAETFNFDTVRVVYTTPQVGTIFDESRVYDRQSLIICVRNLSCISSTRIIRQAVNDKGKSQRRRPNV